ncbi:MAG: hypothetical protein H7Y08_06190, partial [Rhizobiaceae bacterium]|nr:hypothetical protein [Rhizobiaceae bacterium]
MAISKRQLIFGGFVGFIGLVGMIVSGSQAMAQSNWARPSSAGFPPIVAAWAKAWNAGDAAGMAALFTADGVYDDYAFQAS